MGLLEAGRTTANLIRSYGAGELRIGAAVHTTPIVVGRIITGESDSTTAPGVRRP